MSLLSKLGPNGQANVPKDQIVQNPKGWMIAGGTLTGNGNVRLKRLKGSDRFLIVSWPEPATKDKIQGKMIVTLT